MPFLAAVVFATGTLCLKRAFQEGAGVGLAFLLNNVLLGLLFLPLLAVTDQPVPWVWWWFPVLTGSAFFGGQVANFLAVSRGDVSLVTPLLGTKIIFVVGAGWLLFRHELGATHLLAAFLTAGGVFVMGAGELRLGGRALGSALLALVSAMGFGLCDALIQQWAAQFGLLAFAALLFGTVGTLSLSVIPWQREVLLRTPRRAWKWLGFSAALAATQSTLITVSIAQSHDATGVNVIYSLRGLWSIALVWLVGHWFGNRERHVAGGRVMAARFVGALLIVAAVVLVVARK